MDIQQLDIPTYVWTANGKIETLLYTSMSAPKEKEQEGQEVQGRQMETFDNLRRTVSSKGVFIEIPTNNLIKTRLPMDTTPLFSFTVGAGKKYRLSLSIRAKTVYKFKLPVFGRYSIIAKNPQFITEYIATYVSSSASSVETEKKSYALGSVMQVVVDSKLSIIKIDVTFRCTTRDTTINVLHGIIADDPEAELYCMAGSVASLNEVV